MDKQEKIDLLYCRMALIWSENSYAIRRKVGALIVKNNTIISDGYNGTPTGFPNVCEYAVAPDEGQSLFLPTNEKEREELPKLQKQGWRLITYDQVLHAESNAIAKLAKSTNNAQGATIYVTDEPCLECAKLIIQAGIERVVYIREYRLHAGIELLKKAKIKVQKIKIEEND